MCARLFDVDLMGLTAGFAEVVSVLSRPVRRQGGQLVVLHGRAFQAEKDSARASSGQDGPRNNSKVI